MTSQARASAKANPRVALFATCLVDLMRPNVGFAAVKLLEQAGCTVEVPVQTCCGQPAFNNGDRKTAAALAAQMAEAFAPYDYVVVPSGSCGGMIRTHYPELFAGDPDLGPRIEAVAAKTYELVSFLTDIMGVTEVAARYEGTVTYHDSCSGLRELGIRQQPRKLLASVEGLTLAEMNETESCCGFGGTFAVKYGELSDAIVSKKAANIEASAATTVLAGDLGCLMNMAGKLQRRGSKVRARHIAEVLAGMADGPAIGEPAGKDG
ncbi:MAG TPA: (Fe-S)-binding protein [Beijerinckiaceae bacterium]|nr:(Fe-S)-binding protein [Beijerinckiaceae bacterium]